KGGGGGAGVGGGVGARLGRLWKRRRPSVPTPAMDELPPPASPVQPPAGERVDATGHKAKNAPDHALEKDLERSRERFRALRHTDRAGALPFGEHLVAAAPE